MASRGFRVIILLTSPILFAIVMCEVAIFVAMLRGRVELEKGIALAFVGVFGGVVTVVPAIKSLIDGWTRQDEAKINATAPKMPVVQVATGDGATAASSTTNVTPAETPTAKRDSASQ